MHDKQIRHKATEPIGCRDKYRIFQVSRFHWTLKSILTNTPLDDHICDGKTTHMYVAWNDRHNTVNDFFFFFLFLSDFDSCRLCFVGILFLFSFGILAVLNYLNCVSFVFCFLVFASNLRPNWLFNVIIEWHTNKSRKQLTFVCYMP